MFTLAHSTMFVINDLFVTINLWKQFINFTFVLISIRVDFDKLYHTKLAKNDWMNEWMTEKKNYKQLE